MKLTPYQKHKLQKYVIIGHGEGSPFRLYRSSLHEAKYVKKGLQQAYWGLKKITIRKQGKRARKKLVTQWTNHNIYRGHNPLIRI